MKPSLSDSRPHSPVAARGLHGPLGIDISSSSGGGRDALELPPVPPLQSHLDGLQLTARDGRGSSELKGKPEAIRQGLLIAGRQSYALTPALSADSLDVRPRSDSQRALFGSGSSSANSSARESTASSPRKLKHEKGDDSLFALPFLLSHELLTPPFERSEDEGGVRRGDPSAHARRPSLSSNEPQRPNPERASDGGSATFPLISPSLDPAAQQACTQPVPPGISPTPFLRTVRSRTFINMTTTTTSYVNSQACGSTPSMPQTPAGSIAPNAGDETSARPRTASICIFDNEASISPKKRASRPASVRDWRSDDDDDDGFIVTPDGRGGSARRQSSRPSQTTASSPSSASHSTYDHPFLQPSRKHNVKAARSAPDSRTNLAGMLSAALNMSPTSAFATLSLPQKLDSSAQSAIDDGNGELSSENESTASMVAVAGPIPALSKAISAPIAPFAHVLAFVIISLAAAVALSTVLVGSYGLTAWDVTRLRVRDARETLEDSRRRISASVERGRRLIDGAVDGARGLAEGLVDSASAGLVDDEDDAPAYPGGCVRGAVDKQNHRVRSQPSSGQSSADSSANSTPQKPKVRRKRSSLIGKAAASADEVVSQLVNSFWRALKRVVPAAMVKRALEAADVRLGKRPVSSGKAKAHRRRNDPSWPADIAAHSSGNDGFSHSPSGSSEAATPLSPSPEAPSPAFSGGGFESRLMNSSTDPDTRFSKQNSTYPNSDDDVGGPEPSSPAPAGRRGSSALPPRPPLSVLLPSIFLTLVIAFGAMAYNLLRKRAHGQSPIDDLSSRNDYTKSRRRRQA